MSNIFQNTPQNFTTLVNLFISANDPMNAGSVLEQLENIKEMHGFRSALLALIGDRSLPNTARIFASSYFKNILQSWWKREGGPLKNRPPDEKEAERAHLRNTITGVLLSEPSDDIATMLSSSLATITNADFPLLWPEFPQAIFSALQKTVIPQLDNNNQLVSLQLNSTPEQSQIQILNIATRCFDCLNLTVEQFNGRKEALEAVNTYLLTPYLSVTYHYWILYNGLLQQLTPQSPQLIENKDFVSTITTLLALVRFITSFLAKCLRLHPQHILELENGQLADNIFQQFGQCIGTFQQHIAALPSHEKSIAIRNQLNIIRGHCSSAISDCISLSPILFRKYLQPYTELFVNILKQRGDERQRELQFLAMQHSSGEVGVSIDDEDEGDMTIKGKDLCIINSFNFLSKILSNPTYAPVDSNQHSATKNLQTNALLQFQAKEVGYNSTLEASQIAINLMNDQWCLGLGDLIVTKYLSLLRYDVERICNNGDEYYVQQSDATELNSERHAALACYQALYRRTPHLITTQMTNLLQQALPLIPVLVDAPGAQNHNSEQIVQSWQVDAVLYAFKGVLTATQALCESYNHVGVASAIAQTLQTFLAASLGQQSIRAADVLTAHGEALLSKSIFENSPTSFQRIIACFALIQEVGQYLNSEQVCSIWDYVVPYILIDNAYVKLCANQVIHSFADSVALVQDVEFDDISSPSSQTQQQSQEYVSRIVQSSVRLLIRHGVLTIITSEASKVSFLVSIRRCVTSLSFENIIPLLPSIIPPLSQLWQLYFTQELTQSISAEVMRIVSALTASLGSASFILDNVINAILSTSLDLESSSLLDGVLELWESYTSNLPYITDSMINLFKYWGTIISEYPDLFPGLNPILSNYIHLAAYLNPSHPELLHDFQHGVQQVNGLLATFPQEVRQVIGTTIQPAQQNFFAIHGGTVLQGIHLGIVECTSVDPYCAIDALLRCVEPSVLFSLPQFTQILNTLSSKFIPSMYYSIRLTGLCSSGPQVRSNSSLSFPLPLQQHEQTLLSQQVFGLDNPVQCNPSIIAWIMAIFCRLLVTCPQQTVNYFTTLSSPQAPNTPIFLATPLNLFFSVGIHMCDESRIPMDFLRRQIVHGLIQCYAIYQYSQSQLSNTNNTNQQQNQHLQAFITMMNNDEWVSRLFVVLFTECSEDEVIESRFEPTVITPLDLSSPDFLPDKTMAERRNAVSMNHDIISNSRLKDRIQQALQLCESIKGNDFVVGLLSSIPLELSLAVGLR